MLKRAEKQNIPLIIEYVNCKLKKVADTEYRILAELIKKLAKHFNVPSSHISIISGLKGRRKVVEIIEK